VPVNSPPSTPARLTATAAVKLPRLFLLVVGLVYILAGLFYRDPWKPDDVTGLATMLTALSGQAHAWLLPHVGDLAHPRTGPLITWVGALSIEFFAPLFAWLEPSSIDARIIASRLPNLLWFGMLSGSLWYGTYLLGRRPEALPLALPFGGEPHPRDYGRMLADAALLLIVATVGIIWRMHETSEVPALIAIQALALYAVARMLDHPLSGTLSLGLALAAAFLTRGWPGLAPMLVALALIFIPGSELWSCRRWLLLACLLATALIAAWWIPAQSTDPRWIQGWLQWNAQAFGWPSSSSLISVLRDLPWFLWPTWPLVLVALWRWRRWLGAAHVRIPAGFLAGALAVLIFSRQPFEPEYATLAVPSAILAALALPTLRRGVVNTLDWFAIMCFTLTAATVWLGWIALQTGWPAQIAANIARQTRGLYIHVAWPATVLAILGTLAWLALVGWRLRSRPAGLWRGTALSAGGLIATWLLLATLWMPALDYARSYRDVSASLAQALRQHQRAGECVRAQDLGSGQRASFYVFEQLEFSFDGRCPLLLQQLDPDELRKGTAARADQPALWEGRRGPDRHEMFRLLRLHG